MRHQDRLTWEIPGGHIEIGEDARDAAVWELYEETGAINFRLTPVSIYSVKDEEKETYGQLYFAEVIEMVSLPDSEIAEVKMVEELPDHLTYPLIQPYLHKRVLDFLHETSNNRDNEILAGYNQDHHIQMDLFKTIIMKNELIFKVLTRAHLLELENYYIGAGSLVQTVWNYLSGYPLMNGIHDIDLVYFDTDDLSFAAEDKVIQKTNKLFQDIPIRLDVKNQARIHLWYEEHFGYSIEPYHSLESVINTWPTTATAIGVKINHNRDWSIYAPFGLNDLFGKIVRPNKVQITKEIYEKKVNRWLSVWSDLKVIPWDN